MTPLLVLSQEGWNWFGFGMGMGLLLLVLGIAAFILWVWGMIDAATNPALEPAARIVWLLVIFFLPAVGTIAYLLLRPSRAMIGGPGGRIDRPL